MIILSPTVKIEYVVKKYSLVLLITFWINCIYCQQDSINNWVKRAEVEYNSSRYENALIQLRLAETFKGDKTQANILKDQVYQDYLQLVQREKRGSELAGLAYRTRKTNPTHAINIVLEALKLNPESYSAALQLNDILETEFPNFYKKEWFSVNGTTAVALSSDGNIAAFGSYDSTLQIIDLRTNENTQLDFSGAITCLTFGDNNTLGVGTSDNKTHLINSAWEIIEEKEDHFGDVSAVAFSSNEEYIISGGWDKSLVIRNRLTNEVVKIPHEFYLANIMVDNNNHILSSDWGGNLNCWSFDGNLLWSIKAHEGVVSGIDISKDQVYTVGWDGQLSAFDINTGQLLNQYLPPGESLVSVNYIERLNSFLVGRTDGTIKLISSSGNELQTYMGHRLWVTGLILDKSERYLLSASIGGETLLWDLDLFNHQTFVLDSIRVNTFDIDSEEETILSGHLNGEVNRWDFSGNLLQTYREHSSELYLVKFVPGNDQIASGGADQKLVIRDIDGGNRILSGNPRSIVWDVAFTKSGGVGYLSGFDGFVHKFIPQDSTDITFFDGKHENTYGIALSPDEEEVVTGNFDKTVSIWSSDGENEKILKGHDSFVFDVDWSPDGQWIVSAGDEGKVILWRSNGELSKILTGHQGRIYSVGFSHDSRYIISGGRDGDVRMWDTLGRCVQTFPTEEQILEVAFTPQTHLPVSTHNDGKLRIWNPINSLVDKESLFIDNGITQSYTDVNSQRKQYPLPDLANASYYIRELSWRYERGEDLNDYRYISFSLSQKAFESPQLEEKLALQNEAVVQVDSHFVQLLDFIDQKGLTTNNLSSGIWNIRGFIHSNLSYFLHLNGKDNLALEHAKIAIDQNTSGQIKDYLLLRYSFSLYKNGEREKAREIIENIENRAFDQSIAILTYSDVTGVDLSSKEGMPPIFLFDLLEKELSEFDLTNPTNKDITEFLVLLRTAP
jgi:WD40 repeat protein